MWEWGLGGSGLGFRRPHTPQLKTIPGIILIIPRWEFPKIMGSLFGVANIRIAGVYSRVP